jgi:hypothetical protein
MTILLRQDKLVALTARNTLLALQNHLAGKKFQKMAPSPIFA